MTLKEAQQKSEKDKREMLLESVIDDLIEAGFTEKVEIVGLIQKINYIFKGGDGMTFAYAEKMLDQYPVLN